MPRDFDFETVTYFFDSDGDNSVQTINGSDGRLFMLEISHINAIQSWIQLFDTSGTITPGSTTPKFSFVIEKSDATEYKYRPIYFGPEGVLFKNSIKYACTTTPEGSTNPTAGLIINAVFADL